MKLQTGTSPSEGHERPRITDVRTLDGLGEHAAAWTELLLASPAASPMLSYPLIRAFFETRLGDCESWFCLFAHEGERLIGVLPLIEARSIGVAGFRVLLLKTPYDSMHTGSVDCLALPGREDVIETFVRHLARMPRTWPIIRIREIPSHSPTMVYLEGGSGGLAAARFESGAENYIEVPSDIGAFHQRLSSNFRRQLKRGMKKLRELPETRFLCREEERSLGENLRRFEAVENAGWKGRAGSSMLSDSRNSRFLQRAAEEFHKLGWMEWNFLETAGETIGAHFAIRVKRTLYLLKIGYDERFSACSPGNLLIEKVVEHASAAGDVDEINCVADCAWHSNWAMKRRTLHDVIIPPPVPLLAPLLARLIQAMFGRRPTGRHESPDFNASTADCRIPD